MEPLVTRKLTKVSKRKGLTGYQTYYVTYWIKNKKTNEQVTDTIRTHDLTTVIE